MRAFRAAGVFSAIFVAAVVATHATPSFTIANNKFVRDGQPIQILSSCIHYSRIRPELWKDRLERVYALGANAIETYVPWNYHETNPGQFNFKGDRDLSAFLTTAKEVGLMVLLRAGPYMCGEWEFGGLPAWLLNPYYAPNLVIRTYNPTYIWYVDRWWANLFAVVKPHLYENGGPVIMTQMENEFGSYGDVSTNPLDKQYMEHLVSLARQYLGNSVILYTTDGGDESYMIRGTLNGSAVLTLGDFGPGSDPMESFNAQNLFNPPGLSPPMCTEYYTGWLTHWGETMANTSTSSVATWLEKILEVGGSVSLYMGHGGTNFGLWSGANGGGASYQPHITSYDYDAPISEGGEDGYGPDGNKYTAVRAVYTKYRDAAGLPAPCPTEAPAPATQAYPSVTFSVGASFLASASLKALVTSTSVIADGACVNQEALGQNYGFVLYSATIPSGQSSVALSLQFARDRVQVFLNGQLQHTMLRGDPSYTLSGLNGGDDVWLLIENMGRLNYGRQMTDPKGLLPGDIAWSGNDTIIPLTARTIPVEATQVGALPFTTVSTPLSAPAFFKGTLTVPNTNPIPDTYIRLPGWVKGMVWVNGFNVGRYWNPRGPQENLYIPGVLLTSGSNEIIVLEVDTVPSTLQVTFDAAADYSGPVCVPKATAPAAGDKVAMFPCSGAPSQQWKRTTASTAKVAFQTVQNGGLCLAMGPRTDPSTGMPAAELQQCSATAATQFNVVAAGGPVTLEFTSNTGNCLDITSHSTANCAGVELYGCNGGENQQWHVPTGVGSGVITSQQDGHCLTVCGTN